MKFTEEPIEPTKQLGSMDLEKYRSYLSHDRSNAVFRAHHAMSILLHQGMPKSLLDVGCGSGELLRMMQAQGVTEVKGVDGVQDALDQCLDLADQIYRVDLNSEGLPFQDGSFDAVTCLEVLEHLYAPQNTLQEISRVTRQNGYVVLSVPNPFNYSARLRVLFGQNISDPATIGGHIKFFRPFDLRVLCESCGLQDVKISGVAYPTAYKKYGRLTSLLLKWVPALFATWLFAFGKKPHSS